MQVTFACLVTQITMFSVHFLTWPVILKELGEGGCLVNCNLGTEAQPLCNTAELACSAERRCFSPGHASHINSPWSFQRSIYCRGGPIPYRPSSPDIKVLVFFLALRK